MILPIIQIGDSRLIKPSEEVKDFSDRELQKLIDHVLETCEAGVKFTAGLAAPQIGENIQLTVIRRVDIEDVESSGEKKRKKIRNRPDLWEPLLNPKIVASDPRNDSMFWEACLSVGVGKKQLWGPVWRPETVEIEYQDRHGEVKRLSASGFFSHLLQHEIDHLNGKLFLARVENPVKNLWLASDLDEYYDKNDSYPEIE